jgi:hypothetical protein
MHKIERNNDVVLNNTDLEDLYVFKNLNYYINNNNITSLKMDIEGSEVVFINSNDTYPTLKHVAIETHSKEILNNMIKKLLELGFEIDTICTFYPRVYDICNLIYASRK